MNYERMTFEKFGENLKAGKYTSLAGARRAIGKASNWKSSQRDEARALAEKKFGTGDSAKPKPEKKKPGPKPAVAKKAAAAPGERKKPGPKPGTKRHAQKQIEAASAPFEPAHELMPSGLFTLTAEQVATNPHQAVSIADRTIQSVSTAVATARVMKDKNDALDIKEIEEYAVEALRKSMLMLDRTAEAIVDKSMEKSGTTAAVTQLRAVPQAENGTQDAGSEDDELIKRCADAAKAHHIPEPAAAG